MTNVVRVFFCNTTVRSRLSPSVRPLAFTGLVRGGSARTQRIFECVLLCFIKPILGNRYGPGVNPCGTWGGRILTLHLNYVAGYTGPLLFLFERTHQCMLLCLVTNGFFERRIFQHFRLDELNGSRTRNIEIENTQLQLFSTCNQK